MIGASWQTMLITQSLILGVSGAVYYFCLPHLHWAFSLAALAITGSTSGALGLTGV